MRAASRNFAAARINYLAAAAICREFRVSLLQSRAVLGLLGEV